MKTATVKSARQSPELPSRQLLGVYGDFMFLAFRSQYHAGMTTAGLRSVFEPPITLGQYQVFRFDDIPRGLITWARLDAAAEQKYIRREPLTPQEWNSGDRLWIIDFIAPYKGLTHGIGRWLMQPGNLTSGVFHFRRNTPDMKTLKILRVDVSHPTAKSTGFSETEVLAGKHI